MKNMKFAYIFIVSFVVLTGAFVFFSFFGREMLASNFMQSAMDVTDERAIKYYNLALKLSPENATARNNLIDIYLENDDYNQALISIEQGIESNPDNDDLYFYKIKICEKFMDIEQVVEIVDGIKSAYVKSKFSSKTDIEPYFNFLSGEYSQNLEIVIKTPQNANIYYKINAEKYQLYTDNISLTDGFYDIKAVAIDGQGVVSRVVEGEYYIENLIAPVSFSSDDTIEKIKEQLGENVALNRESLLELNELDLSNSLLFDTDIQTLLNCSNLEVLKLGDVTNISDFSPLSKLYNLEVITIDTGCTKELLAQLLAISSLKTLEVSNSKINILPENKTLLTSLTLKNCLIYNIDNISSYKTLESLDFSQNLISDLKGMENLKKLNYLNLSNNKISDISNILQTISIKFLDISQNQIVSISGIGNLSFLENANIANNEIASVIEFANLRYLTTLNCSYNNILTLEPLISSQSLQEIYANDNNISDFSYISQIENLTYINISNNEE